ncbi:hypothetical protein [Bradyrhizobium japonicum]|uniref:hypothetical protein n=1 Tax=Bradyrhizobium japonicum TaxID=375 RepID=UPI0004569201|nr:hypothetical protein [Bradyrhizobium japonicum]AHY56144.1 hypothetical protein BJS_05676 [Bradyrhizobium japonicum SEMIA 5079]MBR0731828.1 hypothetical protein [Bradyrhizobium japonicum]MCD9112008.1 hypothetical protein [Bradyrhizobium japonicum]MCD9259944.1 hypothetical protein [Bradyrhizobium japonicum SEMIA 5079]MCD9820740.1 hypothetical protein [Bradyrhizobium japonicum]
MRRYLVIGLALAALCAASTLAYARPPTVVSSPGYDRRLQESRKALSGSPMTTVPGSQSVPAPKRVKKKHPN